MFRFEDHMPRYWLNESRDFQLLTRIDDILYMGQRADIATIQNLNDSKKCKNTMLSLLAKKVGFFTDLNIPDSILRNIIGAFRTCVDQKGTIKGITQAVVAVLKGENNHGIPRVEINNDDHEIDIFTPVALKNIDALREFLKYLTPAGYIVNIYSYNQVVPVALTPMASMDTVAWSIQSNKNISYLRKLDDKIPTTDDQRRLPVESAVNLNDYMLNTYAGSVSLGIIAALNDYADTKNISLSGSTVSNRDIESGIEIKKD